MTAAFGLLSNYMNGFEPPKTWGSETFSLVIRYTNISDCVQTVHKLPLLANKYRVKYLYTNWSSAKF